MRPGVGFTVATPHAEAVNRCDLDPVDPDGIGPVRRPGAEDPLLRSGRVTAGVNTQYVAPGPIEPGEEKHLLAWPQSSKAAEDFGHEDQHCLRGALVHLARRRTELGERRLHVADDFQVEAHHA